MSHAQLSSAPAERAIFGSFFLDDSEFSLSVSQVQEVVVPPDRYTRVPLAPDYLNGLFNLRGTIIPVVDLRRVLDMPDCDPVADPRIAIVELGENKLGLQFDRTGEIFRSVNEERHDFEARADGSVISGVFRKNDGKRIVQILNVERLFELKQIPHQAGRGDGLAAGIGARRRGNRKQCISFTVGPAKCAFGIDEIQEILKVEKINRAIQVSELCIGTIDLRGSIVPIINLTNLLGYSSEGAARISDENDRRIIVLKIGQELFGMMVDAVDSIISYFQDELIAFPVLNSERPELFLGCLSQKGDDEILLINHEKILMNSEIEAITKGHSKLFQVDRAAVERRKGGSGVRRSFITFSIGNFFAVGIDEIREIIELPEKLLQPPGLPPHFKGVLNLRGKLVTIIDARAMYSIPALENAARSRVLVFERDGVHFGIIVDSVEAIVSFADSDKVKMPDFLIRDDENSLTEDISEAVQVTSSDGKTHSLPILSVKSIAARIRQSEAL